MSDMLYGIVRGPKPGKGVESSHPGGKILYAMRLRISEAQRRGDMTLIRGVVKAGDAALKGVRSERRSKGYEGEIYTSGIEVVSHHFEDNPRGVVQRELDALEVAPDLLRVACQRLCGMPF
jgi:hypothetical protein